MLASLRRAFGDFLVRGLEDKDECVLRSERVERRQEGLAPQALSKLVSGVLSSSSLEMCLTRRGSLVTGKTHGGEVDVDRREGNEQSTASRHSESKELDDFSCCDVDTRASKHHYKADKDREGEDKEEIDPVDKLIKVKSASALFWMLASRPKKTWYSFPSVDALAAASPAELQTLGESARGKGEGEGHNKQRRRKQISMNARNTS